MESEKRSKNWRLCLMTVAARNDMAGTLAAQISKPPVFHTQEQLPRTGWRVMDVLVQLNGHTHFSGVEIYMAEKPEHLANTNIVLLSLSLGTVNLKRFEWQNHIAD